MRILLFGLVLLAGCGKGQFTDSKKADVNVLRVALDAAPATLDPALSQDLATGDVMRQVFEGLVTLDKDSKVVPCLAESYSVSKDGLVYTFKLRPNVKFHDGRAVTAEDVVWTFSRNCDPKLKSPVAKNYLGDIAGFDAVLGGKTPDLSGVKAVDAATVEIRLTKPAPYFLGKLTYPVCSILPKGLIPRGQEINHAAQMIGTGPFHIEIFVPEQAARFVAWKDYWAGKPAIARLEMPIIKDSSTRLNKFRGGELDVAGIPAEEVKAFPGTEKHVRAAIIYIGLNPLGYEPFEDIAVREAFVQAINKEAIVEDILGGIGKVANSILPPGVMGHRPDLKRWSFDPAKAKARLGTRKLPPVELILGGQATDRRKVADAIATQLRQNLGVEVSVRQMEMGAYLQKATGKKLGFFIGTWYADYLDPENFLSVTLASYGQNRVAYANPQFTELCRVADSEMDAAKRMTLYQAAEDLAVGEVAWIPLYFPVDAIATNPRVEGIDRNLLGALPYTSVTIKR